MSDGIGAAIVIGCASCRTIFDPRGRSGMVITADAIVFNCTMRQRTQSSHCLRQRGCCHDLPGTERKQQLSEFRGTFEQVNVVEGLLPGWRTGEAG